MLAIEDTAKKKTRTEKGANTDRHIKTAHPIPPEKLTEGLCKKGRADQLRDTLGSSNAGEW